MLQTNIFLPTIVSWKWIDQAPLQTIEKHLRSPTVNLITLLGHGALKRYTNNNLRQAVDLSAKFITCLPESKLKALNDIFNPTEQKTLFPHILNQVIENGKDTQSKNILYTTSTFTPEQFHSACTRKLYKTAELMLQRGANVNQPNQIQTSTILHYAVAHGDEELVDLLLTYGADVNQQDEHGFTPMHWALATDNLVVLEKLFNKNGDVSIPNSDGESVVAMALKYNKIALREVVAHLFNDFSSIYYLIQDEPMHTVIEAIRNNPQKYIFQHDIGANPLEVPVLLHDPQLARIVKQSLSEEQFQKYLDQIQEKYPNTHLKELFT
jgi:Ankyrin repeats (3 copies)